MSGLISPAFSAASIMATPMRSFTLPAGLKDSSLATTSATAPSVTRRSRTSGVFPISCVTSSAMLMKLPPAISVQDSSACQVMSNMLGINGIGTGNVPMSPDSAVAWWAMLGAVGDGKVFAYRDFYWRQNAPRNQRQQQQQHSTARRRVRTKRGCMAWCIGPTIGHGPLPPARSRVPHDFGSTAECSFANPVTGIALPAARCPGRRMACG